VADGNKPPIDKACGEGLLPDARAAAQRIGIHIPESIGYEFRGVRFHGERHKVEADFPNGQGIGVRRTALHRLLMEAAERAGVDLRWETPVSRVAEIRARWIVGADGATSRVRKEAGLEASARNSRRFAYRRHFTIAPWTDCMEIYWGERSQIYITPVSRSEICVALITRDASVRVEEAIARGFPELRERLAGVAVASAERGAPTASLRLRHVAQGTVALIGDASGSVDAITGEGICLSFKQAALLAEAIAAEDLTVYDRGHPALARKAHAMTGILLMLDRGAIVRRLGFGVMQMQPWIFRRLLAVHVA
jgi:flavin-dependent dehydrogenase